MTSGGTRTPAEGGPKWEESRGVFHVIPWKRPREVDTGVTLEGPGQVVLSVRTRAKVLHDPNHPSQGVLGAPGRSLGHGVRCGKRVTERTGVEVGHFRSGRREVEVLI